jgi:hypothetical protein
VLSCFFCFFLIFTTRLGERSAKSGLNVNQFTQVLADASKRRSLAMRGAEVVIEGTNSDGHLRELARQGLASVD